MRMAHQVDAIEAWWRGQLHSRARALPRAARCVCPCHTADQRAPVAQDADPHPRQDAREHLPPGASVRQDSGCRRQEAGRGRRQGQRICPAENGSSFTSARRNPLIFLSLFPATWAAFLGRSFEQSSVERGRTTMTQMRPQKRRRVIPGTIVLRPPSGA